MAGKSKTTFQKREKERARQKKQLDKEAQRRAAKENKTDSDTLPEEEFDGEDRDIAGIRPGPQPLPDQWNFNDD